MFALQTTGKFEFTCLSKSREDLENSIKRAFSYWSGMQSSGSSKTIDDYMDGKTKVEITIKEI